MSDYGRPVLLWKNDYCQEWEVGRKRFARHDNVYVLRKRRDDKDRPWIDRRITRRVEKYLCINGPIIGQFATIPEAEKAGYYVFNRASSVQCYPKAKDHSAILVYRDTFGGSL